MVEQAVDVMMTSEVSEVHVNLCCQLGGFRFSLIHRSVVGLFASVAAISDVLFAHLAQGTCWSLSVLCRLLD